MGEVYQGVPVKIVCVPLVILATCLLAGFSQPNKEERIKAIGSIRMLPALLQRTFSESAHFEPKKEPRPGDWLTEHDEPGQTYREYAQSEPNVPNQQRSVIYILPIGEFKKSDEPMVLALEEFAAAYFLPMKVQLVQPLPDWKVPTSSRVHQGHKQWNSVELLYWMKDLLPDDAYAMLAVTMTDLYPKDSWNYVFGQASRKHRVGIFSFARYHPSWHGGESNEANDKLMLSRALKILSHETGHMFGIKHCTHFQCNMNGTNNISECDRNPPHLCPVCLRKLHHATGFPPIERYQALAAFYRKHELNAQRRWVDNRVDWIRQGN